VARRVREVDPLLVGDVLFPERLDAEHRDDEAAAEDLTRHAKQRVTI
jgi:hypothetical protein